MTPQNENFARDVQALVLSMPVAQMLKLRAELVKSRLYQARRALDALLEDK